MQACKILESFRTAGGSSSSSSSDQDDQSDSEIQQQDDSKQSGKKSHSAEVVEDPFSDFLVPDDQPTAKE